MTAPPTHFKPARSHPMSSYSGGGNGTRVRIPADVDRADKILGQLTARQVAILAVTGVLVWLLFLATRGWLPLPVFIGVSVAVAALAVVVTFARHDGMPLDRLLWAALRQARRPRRLVPTTAEKVATPPDWIDVPEASGPGGSVPAPLRLPAEAITPDGTIALGRDGTAVVLACSTVNFTLASDLEQHALVDGFGQWLNSLSEPVQVVARTQRVSLTTLMTRLDDTAGGLPHLALETAAREHAAFLRQTATTDTRARQVVLVLRDPIPHNTTGATDITDAGSRLVRRVDETRRALQRCGITVTCLDRVAVQQLLAETCDPYAPPRVGSSSPIVTSTATRRVTRTVTKKES